jgi:hypothetical protein
VWNVTNCSRNGMGMRRRHFHRTQQRHVGKTWNWGCSSTRTTPVTKERIVRGPASLSIWTRHRLLGFSKKQSTSIGTSVFGAEFVVMKHGMETLHGIRYNLRMMGVSLSGPSY